MGSRKLKVLICIPQTITLYKFVLNSYKNDGHDIEAFDALNEIPSIIKFFYHKTLYVPIIKKIFYKLIVNFINKRFFYKVSKNTFDHLFIYNSEYVNDTNIKYCKTKGTKVIYYLGDSIFYTKTFDGNISSIHNSDIILCPDSFWVLLIRNSGIRSKTFKLLPGPNPDFYHTNNDNLINKIVFIGSNYPTSEGHKRAGLFSAISDNLVLYGNKSWLEWIRKYPLLQDAYNNINYLTDYEVSTLINKYKLAIVDANSGIVSGIHQRLLDISQTNSLPLVEYRYGIEETVGNADIIYRDVDQLKKLITRYLENEGLRLIELEKIRNHVIKLYSSAKFIQRICQ